MKNNVKTGKNKKRNTRFEWPLLLLIIILILLTKIVGTTTVSDASATVDENGYPVTDKTLDDYDYPGVRIAMLTGAEVVYEIQQRYSEARLTYYDTQADIYNAISSGKADVGCGYLSQREELKASHPELAFIPEPVAELDYGFATQNTEKGKQLSKEFSEYLRMIIENGEYQKLKDKWEAPDRTGDVMANYTFSGENGQLRIVTGGLWVPMTFYEGKKLTGEFIEMAYGFCEYAGYIPSVEAVTYAAELTGLSTGKYDLMADIVRMDTDKTDDICVTDQLYYLDTYLCVKAETEQATVSKASLFWSKIKTSVYKSLIQSKRYELLASGLLVTLGLTLLSVFMGTILGTLLCAMRMSRNPLLASFASLYIRIFRSIPVLVSMMVMYYVIFKNMGLSAFAVSVIAFTIDFSAYSAEIFRSGISSVPVEQVKAARALGFSRSQSFGKVVLPQAMINIVPVYIGQCLATLKMTSIAGYISVEDLTKASDIIRSKTYEALCPLLITALVYFILSALMTKLFEIAARKVDPANRTVPEDIRTIVGAYVPGRESLIRSDAGHTKEGEREVLLKVDHLNKRYEDVTPINDVSFRVYDRDIISVIGSSGTGKSTLLYLINQLEKPDSGEIYFEGKSCLGRETDLNALRQRIGMVFQTFNLFGHLTIIENLMLAQTELLHRSREDAAARSMELLHMVGLEDKALSFPEQLSGGQKQRAAIVRAVAMDPRMILMDEPTSALDPTMVGEVLTVIKKLAKQGLTMMIVTHEMGFAKDVSNRVFFLDEGVILCEGSPHEILDDPKNEKVRQFIKRTKVLEITLRADDPSYIDAIKCINQFAVRHMISRHVMMNMQIVLEELCFNSIIPNVRGRKEMKICFEAGKDSEDTVRMTATYAGENKDPLEGMDEISRALINNICRQIEHSSADGINTVDILIG